MERFIGLDVGDRHIGVAVSDPLGITAQPVETYSRVGFGPDVRHFCELAERYGTKSFVCGLPRNMNGTEGFQAEKVRLFAEQIEKAGYDIWFEDERLTTVIAEDALMEANMSREGRKRRVDMVAATLILQSFLDRLADSADGEAETGEDEILELEDEDGNPVSFRVVFRIRENGADYLLLDEIGETTDGAFFFLKEILSGETVSYQTVEDDALVEKLYAEYLAETEQEGE